MKRSLEAIKKICKKYRYMFRSDDLYREMNYMIENLSPLLINNLTVSDSSMVLVWNNLLNVSFVCSSLAALCSSVSRWGQKLCLRCAR